MHVIVRAVTDYSALEPAPLTFVVLPVLLACILTWGTAVAWRRCGPPAAAAWRASIVSLAGACAWMAVTWAAAASGILREWTRNPPPFGLLVVAIVGLAFALTYSGFGTRARGAITRWG